MIPRPVRESLLVLPLFVGLAAYVVLVDLHRPSVAANDVYAYFLPNILHAVGAIRHHGSGLLWNPFQNCGVPFFANSVNGLLYPPHLLFLVLDPNIAVHVILMINLVLGAIGMFLLGRELGLSPVAALGGALAFQLGDPMAQLTSWSPMHDGPWTWVPWALLFSERLLRTPTLGGVVGLTLALALELLPGFMLITVLTYQLIAVRLAWELVTRRAAPPWRAASAVASGLALAPLLVAIQILPAAELAAQSLRISGVVLQKPFNLSAILTLAAERRPPLPFMVAPLAVAVVAPLVPSRRRVVTFYALTGVLYGILGLGKETPLFALASHVPFFATTVREHVRLFWVTGFCLALLVAFGLEALRLDLPNRIWPALVVVVLMAVGLSVAAPGGLRWAEATSLACILAAVLAMVVRPRVRPAAVWFVAAAVLLDLVFVPLKWPGQLEWSTDVLWTFADGIEQVKSAVTPQDRVYLMPSLATYLQLKMVQKTASIFGLRGFGDFDSLTSARFSAYELAMGNMANAGRRSRRLFDLAAIGWVLATPSPDLAKLPDDLYPFPVEDGNLRVYRNRAALPRARYVPTIEVVEPDSKLLDRLAAGTDDPTQVALVESALPSGFAGVAGPPRPGAARFVIDDPEHLVLDVDAPQRGFVVLADQYFPGWHATVNGTDVPIVRANYLFRLVEVPAGASRLEFRYRPASFVIGAMISALTICGLVVAVWVRRRSVRH